MSPFIVRRTVLWGKNNGKRRRRREIRYEEGLPGLRRGILDRETAAERVQQDGLPNPAGPQMATKIGLVAG